MEDAGTSEEEDTDSQDSNVPIDHGHVARNYLIKNHYFCHNYDKFCQKLPEVSSVQFNLLMLHTGISSVPGIEYRIIQH